MSTYYVCAPDVKWVVETYGILIVHPNRGAFCSLPYPAAAVWDFVSRGYNMPKIAEMVQHVGGFRYKGEAEVYTKGCLEAWAEAGLICRIEGGKSRV